MGGSPKTDGYTPPQQPTNPAFGLDPVPQQPIAQPPVNMPSFLPQGDPNAMASGLTPQHLAAIAATQAGGGMGGAGARSASSATPSGSGNSASAAAQMGLADIPPELRDAPQSDQLYWLEAKRSGDDALADRLLLAAKMARSSPRFEGNSAGGRGMGAFGGGGFGGMGMGSPGR